MWSDTIATRGNHQPVWKVLLTRTPSETGAAGTTGIYTNPFGDLITGASKLGAVPGFEFFAVPGARDPPTMFDVFPGAPAVTGGDTIVFKGNFTVDDVGKTGVFYRELDPEPIELEDGTELEPAGGMSDGGADRQQHRHASFPAPTTDLRLHLPAQRRERPGGVRRLRQRGGPDPGRHLPGAARRRRPTLTTLVSIGGQGPWRVRQGHLQQPRRGRRVRRPLRGLLGRLGDRDPHRAPVLPDGRQQGPHRLLQSRVGLRRHGRDHRASGQRLRR